jgi:hypothetical protein
MKYNVLAGNNVARCGLDACGSGQEQVAGCCEHGNEALGSIKSGKFLY